MNRHVPFVAACVALAAAVLLNSASAQAEGKDKRSFMKKSQSSGGSSSLNFAPNSSSSSAMSRKLKFGASNSSNSGGSNQFQSMNSFAKKKQLGNATNVGPSTGNVSTMNGLQSNGKLKFKPQKFNSGLTNQNFQNSLNNALLQNGNKNGFKLNDQLIGRKPLTAPGGLGGVGGIGNAIQDNTTGIGKFGKLPKDFTEIGKGNLADQIQNRPWWGAGDNDNDDPPADNGPEPDPGDGPGQGNGNGGNGNGNGNGGNDDGGNPPGDLNGPADDDDHHNDDHHDHCFPWWPPIVIGGGCYHGGWNNGGCFDNIVYCPPVTNITVIEQPIVEQPIVEQPMMQPFVDLELVDVRFVDAGDADRNLGIRYRTTFRNRGTLPVGNFQLLVMASDDGTPKTGAPTGSAEIAGLAPGEVISVDVRLPLSAELATMNALIVAVDSALQIAELDEQNNVVVLDRSKIAAADATTVAAQ